MTAENIKNHTVIITLDDGTCVERKFPVYLSTKNSCKRVVGYIDSEYEPFIDGKGYIYDDQVWFFSREKPKTSDIPVFWYEHGRILFGKTRETIKENFSVKRLRSMEPQDTLANLDPNVPLYDEKALSDINSATSVFVPEIKETDDCLKKLVKLTIIKKNININGLKSKMAKSYSLPNLKTALMNNTKMSVPNFLIWCDLLSISFDIFISDNGTDIHNPLPEQIHYNSLTDTYE